MQALDLLKEKEISPTPGRVEMLGVFISIENPVSANELISLLKKKAARPDRATVFRNLKIMHQAGILAASDFGTGTQYYWLSRSSKKHSHFFFCVECESTEPLEHCGIGPMISIVQQRGCKILSHRVEIMGTCKKCGGGNE